MLRGPNRILINTFNSIQFNSIYLRKKKLTTQYHAPACSYIAILGGVVKILHASQCITLWIESDTCTESSIFSEKMS